MPRWRADDLECTDAGPLPPVEFGDLRGGNAPIFEMRAHPEWNDEADPARAKSDHRGTIEMIVVIMRDHDHVDWLQSLDWHRRRIKAAWPDRSKWRRALAPNRIDQDPLV